MNPSTKPAPCEGCGRPRRECWNAPCLHLETIKARGVRAVQAWVRKAYPKHERSLVVVERGTGIPMKMMAGHGPHAHHFVRHPGDSVRVCACGAFCE